MTISIWHWLIVLTWFGAPILAIAVADREKTLSRNSYVVRTLGLFVGLVVVSVIAYLISEAIGNGISALGGLVFTIFLALWSSHRSQEVGWSKWWSLLLMLPVVGLIFWVILLFKPSHEGKTVTA
jgi:uncharacterized membrane protein YhaH (DUF805 family)